MMYQLNQANQRFALSMQSGDRGRSVISTIALSKVLADKIGLPTGKLDDISTYFKTTYELECLKTISKVNELFLIDDKSIIDMIRKFWIARYYVAFPPMLIHCNDKDTAISDAFSLNIGLDRLTIFSIQTEYFNFTNNYNNYVELLKELEAC